MKRSRAPVVTGLSGRPGGATRRTFLLATAAVPSGFGVPIGRPSAHAQQPAPATLDDPGFLRLSKAVTGHADPDATIASRMMAALRRAEPTFIRLAASLARLVHDGQEPEALLAAADATGLRDTMLTLVAAWYTGTVGHRRQAEMVSYVDALMYRPVSDGLRVPTYCGGPIWWTEPPPAAGVSAPAGMPLAPSASPPMTPKGGRAMPAPSFGPNGDASADVIVVGSGVVGAMIADQLASQGYSVLILEAGLRIERAQAVENWRNMSFENRVGSDFQGLYPQAPNAPAPLYFPANNYVGLFWAPMAAVSSRGISALWAERRGIGPLHAGAICRSICA